MAVMLPVKLSQRSLYILKKSIRLWSRIVVKLGSWRERSERKQMIEERYKISFKILKHSVEGVLCHQKTLPTGTANKERRPLEVPDAACKEMRKLLSVTVYRG